MKPGCMFSQAAPAETRSSGPDRVYSSAASRVLGLEPENAAEPAVDVIHEGSGQLTRRLI